MKGIYCYRDLENDSEIVYVGKDSHIDKDRRHKVHMSPSYYNDQQINRVIQNNPDRYKYEVLRTGEFSNNWLSALEILYIRRYQPKFNFTIGGEGTTGYKHTNEAKIKMSKSHKGKTVSKETKRKISEAQKGKTLSEEHKRKISEANKGKTLSEETKRKLSEARKGQKPWNKGKTLSDECKQKLSEAHTKKYARIIKTGIKNGKQLYGIRKDGKRIKWSLYPHRLVEWFKENYPKEILVLYKGE